MEHNLKDYTSKDVETYCHAVMMARDYNEEIDENYLLTFKALTVSTSNKIQIHYAWFPGKLKQPEDPTMAFDDADPSHGSFSILKTESFRKLTKEIMDAIDEVTKEPFNPVMERESC